MWLDTQSAGQSCLRTITVLMLFGSILIALPASAGCNCGDAYCLDTPEYQAALAAKKRSLKAASENYPARFIALLDRMDRCQECITASPDGFQLLIAKKLQDGQLSIQSSAWDPDNESNGANDASLSLCVVIYARHYPDPPGCGLPNYRQRTDYDATYDYNKGLAVRCQAN